MTEPVLEDAPAASEARAADAATAPSAAAEPPWLPAPVAWYSVAMISLVAVFSGLDNGVLALLVNHIKRDMHLSDVQIGLLVGGAYSASYFVFGLPMARVADAGRRKLILPGALFVFSLGTFCIGISQNFWQFLLSRMLVGAGGSTKAPVSASLIPDLIPRKYLTRAFAIYHFATTASVGLSFILGGLVLGWLAGLPPLVVPVLGLIHDWQIVFFTFSIPGCLVALLMVLTLPEPVRRGRKAQGKAPPLSELFRFLFKSPATRVLIPLLLGAAVSGIEIHGIGTWRPAFYERTYGLKPQDFGPIIGASSFITIPLGLFLGAMLVEHFGRKGDYGSHMKVVFLSHATAVPLTIISPLMPTFWLALGCSMVSAVLTMMASPAQLTAMQVVTPNEFRAQVNATYMLTVGLLGFGLGPLVIGAMTDLLFDSEAHLRYAMVTMAAIGGPIALLLYGLAVRPYSRVHRQAMEAEGAGARPVS
jgi:MFS family permease